MDNFHQPQQISIFEDMQEIEYNALAYAHYQFPRPQYLGSKHNLLNWIYMNICNHLDISKIKRCLDGFAGAHSVSFFLKQQGFEVISNDFLNANFQIGNALIANKNIKLNSDDIEILFSTNEHKKNLVEKLYTGIFFDITQAKWLDNIRANINLLDNEYKKSLVLTILNRSMQRKIIMGHFAHTKAISYANNPERVKRNASIARPINELFCELLDSYNNAVFDNHQHNLSYNENILDLLPQINNIDLVYYDPPYTDSHSDYQSFYHLLETYVEYWEDKEFKNGTNRYYPQRWSGFDKKGEVVQSLNKLFHLSKDIPYWVISWNDRSYPTIDEFKKILLQFKKNVIIEQKIYSTSRGGKGSVAGSNEILFICY